MTKCKDVSEIIEAVKSGATEVELRFPDNIKDNESENFKQIELLAGFLKKDKSLRALDNV
jgi:hypothetical protein